MDAEWQSQPPRRLVRLVLVTPDGVIVGCTGPFPVAVPWWQEAQSVVSAARDHLGVDVTILRLLTAERERPHGGEVTYLAEVARPIALQPWDGRLDPHPLRQRYAEAGGPTADLAWALRILAERGRVAIGKPVQIRSWNLSSIWTIPLVGESVWLKVVPHFFAHEARVLAALADAPVPRLLGHDGNRMLLAEVPGDDMYDAPLSRLFDMIDLLVEIQASWMGSIDGLLSLALPDWRGPALAVAISDVIERTSPELSEDDRAQLRRFAGDLGARLADLDSCGLPDTLIHGDFHPGNVRGTAREPVLLDWGDSGIGHPMLDLPAFLASIAREHVEPVKERWVRAWRARLPGCEPDRAAGLIAPIAAARQAVVYRRFLDNIEPAERVYHRHEPADWLRLVSGLLATENR